MRSWYTAGADSASQPHFENGEGEIDEKPPPAF